MRRKIDGRIIVGWRGMVVRADRKGPVYVGPKRARKGAAERDARRYIIQRWPASFEYRERHREIRIFARPVYGPDPSQMTIL